MRCLRCGQDNPPQARFCMGCGSALGARCRKCGTDLAPAARFCSSCGEPVPAGRVEPRFGAPETYTPKHLAERMLTSAASLEGERKQVTVLFADLKGSMELVVGRDPEEARNILDPVLERMIEAVHEFEGTVNQVMGDGIMALFGAPLAHEDHAVRACYAALRMQDAIRRYSDELEAAGTGPIALRIGLNSGDVVVRSIGSDLHMDYTAVGETVHLAARMEQIADPGSIVATVNTFRLAEGYVRVQPPGQVVVKGRDTAIETYVVTGVGPVRWRLEAAAARGLTPFIGRDPELAQLHRAQRSAALGHGQVIGVVGEPGVGKSRLLHEFTRPEIMPGWLVLKVGAASYGGSVGYLPVIDLLRAYFHVEARDDGRVIQQKVTDTVVALDKDLAPVLPALLALLQVPIDAPEWDALDPRERRRRTMEAVRALLDRESKARPLCLVFEDLQWIDSETQAFLNSLVEGLPQLRLLLLVSYRPEYRHEWGGKSCYTQLRVDPLPPANAEQMARVLVGEHEDVEPVKRLLIEWTEGNPFFLEESVRALVETNELMGERGAYRLARRIDGIQVPVSVQAVLAARIDRLPAQEKMLLETAAVVGKEVSSGLLQAIAGLPEEDLHRGLRNLQIAELVYESRVFPDLEYTFKHSLTHEVASQSLLHDRRRALHAQIVSALERLHPDRLSEHVERLAHHALQGEVWDKAVSYCQAAGTKATARSATREAVAFFEQALKALAHLPESRQKLERSIDLRFALRTALTPLGQHETTAGYLRQAEPLAEALGDPHRLGRVSVYMSDHRRLMGDHEGAIESARRALAIAESLDDATLRAMANSYLGLAYYARGDCRRAAAFFTQNLDFTAEVGREGLETAWLPAVHSRAWLATSLAELGEFHEGLGRAAEAVALAKAANHAPSLCVAYFGVGQSYLRKGDVSQAIAALEQGMQLSRTWNFWLALPNIAAALGSAYALAGRVADALHLVGEAVEQSESMKRAGLHSMRIVSVAEAYLRAGRVGDAAELGEQALKLSREHRERGCEGWALRLLGDISQHGRRVEANRARAFYDQARALAHELGMRPLSAHASLGLGMLHRRTDEPAAARDHLGAAAALFRDMEMSFWLGRAQAELEALTIPS